MACYTVARTPTIETLAERFWAQVDKGDGSGCWLWVGPVSRDGYGRHGQLPRRDEKAHRLAFDAAYGPIPKGMTVGHHCHDRAAEAGECPGGPCLHRRCVNPKHLVLQTIFENNLASPYTLMGRLARRSAHV